MVTVNRALFSSYNRDAHGLTQHILVRDAHARAISRLLGGFSSVPAPLPGGAAIPRSRQSFRRRLVSELSSIFSGLIILHLPQAEGINTQPLLKRG
jgi:hypothetical protein